MKLFDGLYLVGSGAIGIGLTQELDSFVYLIDGGKEKALLDAGAGVKPDLIEEQILAQGVRAQDIGYLILTHGHADHSGGASYFKSRYNIKVIAPAGEAEFIRRADSKALGLEVAKEAGFYPADYNLEPCPVDVEVSAGNIIKIGCIELLVYDTPGHSPGGASYYGKISGRNVLFVGDLLFFGGRISLQNIPGVDLQRYRQSVLQLVGLKVDAFLPGHLSFTVSGGQQHIDAAANAFKNLGIPQNIF